MPSDGRAILAAYMAVDAVASREPGGHATSPPWLAFLERWLLSGRVRAVVRKGRQAGGSEVFGHRLPVTIALFGTHAIAPGTRARVLFVSQRQKEADDKLFGVAHLLDLLHQRYSRSGDTIELADRPIVFQSFPCSEMAVRGPTCVYALEDELAIWRNADGANPAHRIDQAILPSGVTQENFRIAAVSSPIGTEDFHAELFKRGETASQCIAEGPSWYWNPAITLARTHELQPDEVAWRREFAAMPQGSLSSAWDPEAIEYAFEPRTRASSVGSPVVALDPAGSGQDSYAICGIAWTLPLIDPDDRFAAEPVLDAAGRPTGAVIVHRDRPLANYTTPVAVFTAWNFQTIASGFRQHLSIDEIADRIAALARSIGAPRAVTDRSEAFSLVSLLERRRLKAEVYSFGGLNGVRVVSRFRQLLNVRSVYIEAGEAVKQQFLAFEERIGQNGITYHQGRDASGGHFDDVSAVLVGVQADLAGHLMGGPERSGGTGLSVLRRGRFVEA
jgi:hypothetical protein